MAVTYGNPLNELIEAKCPLFILLFLLAFDLFAGYSDVYELPNSLVDVM